MLICRYVMCNICSAPPVARRISRSSATTFDQDSIKVCATVSFLYKDAMKWIRFSPEDAGVARGGREEAADCDCQGQGRGHCVRRPQRRQVLRGSVPRTQRWNYHEYHDDIKHLWRLSWNFNELPFEKVEKFQFGILITKYSLKSISGSYHRGRVFIFISIFLLWLVLAWGLSQWNPVLVLVCVRRGRGRGQV